MYDLEGRLIGGSEGQGYGDHWSFIFVWFQ